MTTVSRISSVFITVLIFLTVSICNIYAQNYSNATQSADTVYTYVNSEGIGRIAVRIEFPERPRYSEGAPIVVEVGTWFVHYNEFHRVNDTKRIGAVTISYLWPGRIDAETGMQSDGTYDYGGPVSLRALKDVIRFSSGLIPDENGTYISGLSSMPLLLDNVGLFASSHAGVVGTNVMAYFGEEIPTVKYFIGRENPTRDEMYPLELGYFDGNPSAENRVTNPFFREDIYLPDTVIVDYSTVCWYHPEGEPVGRPYFAANDSLPEHILGHDKTPQVNGKRYYSRALTRALLDNGALTEENWPESIGSPAEVDTFWHYRITVNNYPDIATKLPNLKVMLVFSRYDHVQAARTKPHIRQAWDGFFETGNLWVRKNPDRAYVQSIDPGYGQVFPDNLANRAPLDWNYIEDWGFPADYRVRYDVWLASVAEMADRVYSDNWSGDLDSVMVPVLLDSVDTSVNYKNCLSAPEKYRMLDNYPNPFNNSTTIRYYLLTGSHVNLAIYNIQGEKVKTLVQSQKIAGSHEIQWDGRDNSGWSVTSGVYFCRMRSAHGQDIVRKVFLLK